MKLPQPQSNRLVSEFNGSTFFGHHEAYYDFVEFFAGAKAVTTAMREARTLQGVSTARFFSQLDRFLFGYIPSQVGLVGVELDRVYHDEHKAFDFLTAAGFALGPQHVLL